MTNQTAVERLKKELESYGGLIAHRPNMPKATKSSSRRLMRCWGG